LRASARSQAQLAVSADGEHWSLINASPDLRYQIESFPALHPRPSISRHSPIYSVVLTSAEVDAALGLLLLRESQPFHAYATDAVRELLLTDNNMFAVLRRQPDQVRWHSILPGGRFHPLPATEEGLLTCAALTTHGAFPGHISAERSKDLRQDEAVIGLILQNGTRKAAFVPGAQDLSHEWLKQMEDCDVIFFDGTFWSDNELIDIQGGGKTAREMGHSPVSGVGGTLERFASLRKPRKIFIHINNTNPMLDEDSAEYAQVREAGWELAFDGMELQL